MKTFKVTTLHTVYIDNYEQGEGRQVNCYSLDKEIKADTPKEAIMEYLNDFLGYDNIKTGHMEKDEEKDNVIHTSTLVDEDNNKPSERDIELWKNDKKVLYSNSIYLMIHEIKEVEILL